MEWNLDRVEIARYHGVGKELPRLISGLTTGVAARDVRQREHAHPRFPGDERSLTCGRMAGLTRSQ